MHSYPYQVNAFDHISIIHCKYIYSFTETGPNKLTVGKIFGGMLILENWKLTRFMPIPLKKGGAALPVSNNEVEYNFFSKFKYCNYN